MAKKKPAKTKAPATRSSGNGIDDHPQYRDLVAKLKPGWHAGGLLLVTAPGALDEEMTPWLMGKIAGRRSIGRTVFGDFVLFRDLRERARETGTGDPENEGDVAMVDIHYKKMEVLGYSVSMFLENLNDPKFQRAFFRKDLADAVNKRIGAPQDSECYAFLPALALGGSEDAASVKSLDWRVQQAILIQT